MSNKEHEITAQWHPGTMFAGLAAEDGLGLTTEDGIAYLVMPIHTAKAPTDDVHVRRAMIAATDYEQMVAIEKVTEELTAANRSRTALPAALSGYDASAPLFDQDTDEVLRTVGQLDESSIRSLRKDGHVGGTLPPPAELGLIYE